MLRYLTAGESHGKCLTAILEGVPAGLALPPKRSIMISPGGKGAMDAAGGCGSSRTASNSSPASGRATPWATPSACSFATGTGRTGRDHGGGTRPASTEKVVTCPRPGHADLVGAIKYNHHDIRNVLEKASARETAIRVAVGAVAKRLLAEFGMKIYSYTVAIGGVRRSDKNLSVEDAFERAEKSEVRCPTKPIGENDR